MITIDLADREELIDRLEQFPLRLDTLIAEATPEALAKAGPGGSPGAVELLAYLRDFEELFHERTSLMIAEDNPRLARVEDSLWPIERDYVNQDPLMTLHDFIELRRQDVAILLDLPVAGWERTGQHPVHGNITVRQYAERVIERDEEYEERLRQLLGGSDAAETDA